MSSVRPYTDAHAIVHLDVGIGFKSPLLDEQIEALKAALHDNLADSGFRRSEEDEELEGMHASFVRADADGQELEELHIHPRHVHLVHRDYRGWSFTRNQIVERLAPVLVLASSAALDAEALILDVRDTFVYDDPSSFNVREIFKDSDYLPAKIRDWGQRWRTTLDSMQEMPEGSAQVITRVHFDAGLIDLDGSEESQHLTDIYHRQAFIRNDEEDQAVEWSGDRVIDRLDWMHAQNKSLLLEILVDDLAARIGLKEMGS